MWGRVWEKLREEKHQNRLLQFLNIWLSITPTFTQNFTRNVCSCAKVRKWAEVQSWSFNFSMAGKWATSVCREVVEPRLVLPGVLWIKWAWFPFCNDLLILVILVLCVWMFCVHVCAPCLCLALGGGVLAKEEARSPETGVTDIYDLPRGHWEPNQGPLEELLALLTVESSPQPQGSYLCEWHRHLTSCPSFLLAHIHPQIFPIPKSSPCKLSSVEATSVCTCSKKFCVISSLGFVWDTQ